MTHYNMIDVSVQLFSTQTVDTSDDEVYEFFTSPFIFTIGETVLFGLRVHFLFQFFNESLWYLQGRLLANSLLQLKG